MRKYFGLLSLLILMSMFVYDQWENRQQIAYVASYFPNDEITDSYQLTEITAIHEILSRRHSIQAYQYKIFVEEDISEKSINVILRKYILESIRQSKTSYVKFEFFVSNGLEKKLGTSTEKLFSVYMWKPEPDTEENIGNYRVYKLNKAY